MPIFSMPIVLKIEAESIEEARKAIEEWIEEEAEELPAGTEDIIYELDVELNDEGQRVILLPAEEDDETSSSDDDDDDDEDDFQNEDL